MGKANVREVAVEVLATSRRGRASTRARLERALAREKLSRADTSLLWELVLGVMRRRLTLDWIIKKYSRPKGHTSPWIREILRLGIYQLLYLDRIPDFAATNESVNLARKLGGKPAAGYVNAILRQAVREREEPSWESLRSRPVKYLSLKHSHPEWLVARWLKRYGERETELFCEANNREAPLCLRANSLRIGREKLKQRLKSEGREVAACKLAPLCLRLNYRGDVGKLNVLAEGLCQVQDEAAMLVSDVVSPRPGERVLDLCAAPGGKTTHMAELMENRGLILAVDLKEKKLARVRENCARLGINIVETLAADGRDPGGIPGEDWDRVLVDAPCSNLGVLRRRVEARWRVKEEDIQRLASLGSELLRSGARKVRPGGLVVYTTCTLEPEEDEGLVVEFLRQNPDFSLDKNFPSFLQPLSDPEGCLRAYPYRHDMDGIFAARLHRR